LLILINYIYLCSYIELTLFTDNIIYRIAVIPADVAASVNTANINEVMSAMKVDSVEIVR